MSAPGPRSRGAEEGSATVEFIGWTVGVVVPVLYLIVALAQIQAASFAVASAADAAARVLAVHEPAHRRRDGAESAEGTAGLPAPLPAHGPS